MADKKKHHKFKHSHVEWHDDGSATLHHQHESDPKHDVKHAAADHDSAMDSIMDHTSEPNPGEVTPTAAPGAGAPPPAPMPGA